MKKYILNFIFITVLLSGCSDDYFNVNTRTGSATEDQLAMNDLLGPAIYHTVIAQYWAERSFGNYTQYFTGQGGTAAGATSISSSWRNIYLYALPNINTITKKAKASDSNHFLGIGQVLTAINLGLATDSWDAIPYLDASSGIEDLTPSFDSQESIYSNINSLLDEAITNLTEENQSAFSPSNGDIVYKGDIQKWIKLAYTLKARYTMHLSEVNNSAPNDALTYLEKGMNSNSDDFQIFFDEKNINPWYSREVRNPETGNSHDKIGDQLISYMDGSIYPFQSASISIDPRISVYADNQDGSGTPYRGYLTGGNGLSSDGESGNTDFADNGYYTSVSSPIAIITYSEALFIKAEAAFLANGGTTTSTGTTSEGYTAYLDAITANMDKLGVSSGNYINDGSINVGETNLMLNNIMKEKYIANFLNPETFVDFRRYDFSEDVFKGLTLPENTADSEFPNEWLVRAQYPSSEETRNPENVNANKKAPTEPVWWDQ